MLVLSLTVIIERGGEVDCEACKRYLVLFRGSLFPPPYLGPGTDELPRTVLATLLFEKANKKIIIYLKYCSRRQKADGLREICGEAPWKKIKKFLEQFK